MAAKTFDDMTFEELGKLTRSRYDRLCAAHDMGLDDGPHPSERWAADTEILKAHRAACAADENSGLGPVEIQNKRKPGADEQQPDVTGGLPSKKPAMDSARKVAAMAAAIPGYTRLKRR
jgi:hypothetical protein